MTGPQPPSRKNTLRCDQVLMAPEERVIANAGSMIRPELMNIHESLLITIPDQTRIRNATRNKPRYIRGRNQSGQTINRNVTSD
ncbi:MAG: hypothetical protein M0Q91_06805 [Methanoregula sp.]|nr:hypothetical protein [Methanoregula sp.]